MDTHIRSEVNRKEKELLLYMRESPQPTVGNIQSGQNSLFQTYTKIFPLLWPHKVSKLVDALYLMIEPHIGVFLHLNRRDMDLTYIEMSLIFL